MMNCADTKRDRGQPPMLQAFLMRSGLSLVSALLGGFGVFCVIYSFDEPDLAAQALILLGSALAITFFTKR